MLSVVCRWLACAALLTAAGIAPAQAQMITGSAHPRFVVRDAAGGPPVEMEVKNDKGGLQRLEDARGKTILPAIYMTVKPLSTTTAIVRRKDRVWGFVDLQTKAFRQIPSWQRFIYHNFNGRYPAILLYGGFKGDHESFCFIKADGMCGTRIERISPEVIPGQPNSGLFFVGDKVLVNQVDESGRRYSSTLSWNGDVLLNNAPPVVGVPTVKSTSDQPDSIAAVIYDLGPSKLALGDFQTNLDWPVDAEGKPAAPRGYFKGMFPVFMQHPKNSLQRRAFKGYALVYELDDARLYSFAPDETDAAKVLMGINIPQWLDLHFEKAEESSTSIVYALAGQRLNGNKPGIWLSLFEPGTPDSMQFRLSKVAKATEGFASPDLAIRASIATNDEARLAVQRLNQAKQEERNARLASMQAQPNTMYADDALCVDARQFAFNRTDAASRRFLADYSTVGYDACRYMPRSIYNAMVQAGVYASRQNPANREKSFAELMAEAANKPDFNKGKTLSCYVRDGRTICDYN